MSMGKRQIDKRPIDTGLKDDTKKRFDADGTGLRKRNKKGTNRSFVATKGPGTVDLKEKVTKDELGMSHELNAMHKHHKAMAKHHDGMVKHLEKKMEHHKKASHGEKHGKVHHKAKK